MVLPLEFVAEQIMQEHTQGTFVWADKDLVNVQPLAIYAACLEELDALALSADVLGYTAIFQVRISSRTWSMHACMPILVPCCAQSTS